MGVTHIGLQISGDELFRRIESIARATLQNAAIGRAGIRVYDGGWIRIEGGGLAVTGIQTVSGDLIVTGVERVEGRLEGDGVFDWSGAMWLRGSVMVPGNLTGVGSLLWSGPWEMRGNGDLTGNVALDGDLSLRNGRIVAGSIIIDKNGGYGGRLTAATLLFDSTTSRFTGTVLASEVSSLGDVTANGDLSVLGNSTVAGAKSFRMPHPLKDEHWLQHGCTESPISGTEYTGRVTIGDDGSAIVELPDYFEALNKPRNRTVQVTPVGRPFPVGADEVVDGEVTVYGDPGRDVFWLVKAERIGGDFETEGAIPAPPVSYD